jgi:hypothetical protein
MLLVKQAVTAAQVEAVEVLVLHLVVQVMVAAEQFYFITRSKNGYKI